MDLLRMAPDVQIPEKSRWSGKGLHWSPCLPSYVTPGLAVGLLDTAGSPRPQTQHGWYPGCEPKVRPRRGAAC